MKKLLVCLGAAIVACGVAFGDVIVWQENFSDVSDWFVAYQPPNGAGATITSDGTFGNMHVESNDSIAAFSPASYMLFNEVTWDTYSLNFDVDAIEGSMSYSVGFDEWGATTNYLGAVTVHPQGTFVGTTNYALSTLTWAVGTELVRPKLTMSTGTGSQDMQIDDMQLTSSIPEPATAVFVGLGLAAGLIFRKRARR